MAGAKDAVVEKDNPILSEKKNYLIINNLCITGKIGRGSFATDINTNETVAVKMEQKSQSKQFIMLEREKEFLSVIKNQLGFPKLYSSGQTSNQNYIVLQYLGLNLGQLVKKCDGKFSLLTTAMIGFQIVERLESMHNCNYLHRDVKPENFLIGIGQEYGIIYVVDFGLTKKFINPKTKKHIKFDEQKGLVGTARYISISTHKGHEQGRKDDFESLAYLLIYFAKGSLP